MLDAISLQFVCICGGKDLIPSNFGRDDLADDIFVCETDNEAVFRGIVLVFGLCDEAFAGVVVGFALTTTLVFRLKPAVYLSEVKTGYMLLILPVVGTVLDELGERLHMRLGLAEVHRNGNCTSGCEEFARRGSSGMDNRSYHDAFARCFSIELYEKVFRKVLCCCGLA